MDKSKKNELILRGLHQDVGAAKDAVRKAEHKWKVMQLYKISSLFYLGKRISEEMEKLDLPSCVDREEKEEELINRLRDCDLCYVFTNQGDAQIEEALSNLRAKEEQLELAEASIKEFLDTLKS